MIIKFSSFKTLFIFCAFVLLLPALSFASSLFVSPNTGVYVSGKTFTVKVMINTEGKSINAAEGSLKFNPQEMTVVSIDKSSSIFNLWVTEPTFSNTAGTISFSGGMPSGYKGSSGSIFNITFRTTSAGTGKLSFNDGSVLANDGMGTNILSSMSGGTFTIQAPTSEPAPEVVEYVAPANTPSAPKIQSSTHKDNEWTIEKTAKLNWSLPNGVVAVRTTLDTLPNTIPTKVYDSPISEITLSDLSEGISYFHLQFKNSEGWGKVSHFPLRVDSEKPESFTIVETEDPDYTNPVQTIKFEINDKTSGVIKYKVKLNDSEPFEFIDEKETRTLELPSLMPGYNSIVAEAFDRAGNSIIATYSFEILAFDKPVFTEYPNEINEEVIPVIRGTTRSNSEVEVIVRKIGAEPNLYKTVSDDKGVFTFIPEGTFTNGVYELTARSKDQFGAISDLSEVIRIAVQEPGYVRVGGFLIDLLSVIIPLVAMTALMILAFWFVIVRFRNMRKRVFTESSEAVFIARSEFDKLQDILQVHKSSIIESRKAQKLTKTESDMFDSISESIVSARKRVEKEVTDVEDLVQKKR